ncbi:Tc toxin subunit A-related protein [Achromobacter aloeverae]
MNASPSAIEILERHSRQPAGTLAALGIASLAGIVRMRKTTFAAKYHEGLGGKANASLLYRYALALLRHARSRRARSIVSGQPYIGVAPDDISDPNEFSPTWVNQFGVGGPYAAQGSLGAQDSPVAYAAMLYDLATELETEFGDRFEPDDPGHDYRHKMIPLSQRRPDIARIALTSVTESQVIPKLDLVNQVLQQGVDDYLAAVFGASPPDSATREEFTARIAYPADKLPYHAAYDQARQACDARHLSLFQLIYATDAGFPCVDKIWPGAATDADIQAAGLSPALIAVLESQPGTSSGAPGDGDSEGDDADDPQADYRSRYYGNPNINGLNDVAMLGASLGAPADRIKEMLCVDGAGNNTAVTLTASYAWTPPRTEQNAYENNRLHGARYLCADGPLCLLGLAAPAAETMRLANTPADTPSLNTAVAPSFFVKIHKLMRLHDATGLPFDQLDALIVAAASASLDTPPAAAPDFGANTYRLLGLYERWKASHGATLEDICSFAYRLALGAVGNATPQFDRIFNSVPGMTPLRIDDGQAFDPADSGDAVVVALCAALKIDHATFRAIAAGLPQVSGKIALSLDNYTALFNLVRIPSCLGISPQAFEALMLRVPDRPNARMLERLRANGPRLKAAGGATDGTEQGPDLIDCLNYLEYVLALLKQRGISLAAYLATTALYYDGKDDLPAPAVATQKEVELVNGAISQSLPARVNVTELLQSLPLQRQDYAAPPVTIDWRQAIAATGIVDSHGLIAMEYDADRTAAFRLALDGYQWVAGQKTVDNATPEAIANMDAASLPLREAFDAAYRNQWQVTDSVLQQALGLDSTELMHEIIRTWADGVVNDGAASDFAGRPGASYVFLSACDALNDGRPIADAGQIDGSAGLLKQLGLFSRMALVAITHGLGAPAVRATAYRQPSDDDTVQNWFGFVPRTMMGSLYMLTPGAFLVFCAYGTWRELADSEDDVLQYLADVHLRGDDMTADQAALRLSGQIGATVEDVKAAAPWAGGDPSATKILTVAQMLKALGLLSTAARAGLTAAQLLRTGALAYKADGGIALNVAADPAYLAWRGVAANLLAGVGVKSDSRLCPPAPDDAGMETVRGALARNRRNGLCGAWQVFIARQIYRNADLALTQQEVSEYLLTDTQVTQDVDTSVLADAIASLQLYINNIFNATEPGYEGVQWAQLDYATVLDDWQQIDAQYSTWAANVELGEYPENYLAPPLRPDQTQSFQAFCTNLQQGPIDEPRALDALQKYLSAFERIANLTVVSGYMDEINGGRTDAYAFLTGRVHLIGRTATEPGAYFLRRVDLMRTDDKGYPLTDAWTDWQEITVLGDAGRIVGIPRVATHNSRPSVCWFEREIIEDSEQNRYFEENNTYAGTHENPQNAVINPLVRLTGYVSFLMLDGTWSMPQEVASAQGTTYGRNSLFYYYKESDGVDPVESDYWTMAFEHRPTPGLPPVLYAVLYADAAQAKSPDDPENGWQYALVGTLDAFDEANTTNGATVPADYWETFAGTTGLTDDEKKQVQNPALTGQSRVQAGAEGNAELPNGNTQVIVDDFPVLASGFDGAAPQALARLTAETPQIGDAANVLRCKDKTGRFTYQPGLNLHGDSSNPVNPRFYQRGCTFSQPNLIEKGSWTVDFSDSDYHRWTGTLYIKLASNCGFTFKEPDLSAIGASNVKRYLPQLYFKDYRQYQWYTRKIWTYAGLELEVDLVFYDDNDVADARNNTPAGALSYDHWGDYLIRFSDNNCVNPSSGDINAHLNPDTLNVTVQTPGYDKSGPRPKSGKQTHWGIDADNSAPMNFNTLYTPVISLGNYRDKSNWKDGNGVSLALFKPGTSKQTVQEITPSTTFDMTFSYTRQGADMYVGILETDENGGNMKTVWRGDFFREAGFFALQDKSYPFLDSHLDPDFGTAQMLNMLGNHRDTNSKDTFPLIRLNTTFARMLVGKASQGLQSLYAWNTQSAYEPKLSATDAMQPQLDYEGANSIYFWEIFFHCPAMIAYLLSAQGDHAGALAWLQRIFDPRARNQIATLVIPDADGTLRQAEVAPYWKSEAVTPTRPGSTQRASEQPWRAIAPFALAYADTTHYRKWTYMQYIRALTAVGDDYYRRLTRDGVNQAYQCYARALSLLGPRLFHSISAFPPGLALADVTIDFKEAVREEIAELVPCLPILVPALLTQAAPAVKWADTFDPTTNPQLEGLWDTLDARLYNIRHNLDINGTPMRLPLYAAPGDPGELQSRAVGAATAGAVVAADTMPIPPYRYQAIAGLADKAVGALSSLGNTLLGLRSSQDGRRQEQLQMSQLLQLWSFTDKAAQQGIDIARATLKSLNASLQANREQQEYYVRQIRGGDSPLEIAALSLLTAATTAKLGAQGLLLGIGGLRSAPNIFGLAVGGQDYGALPSALAGILMATSDMASTASQGLFQQAGFRRRREEWQNALDNLKATEKVTRAQIEAQEIQLQAATTSRELAQAQHRHNLEMYDFLRHRFTNDALYGWMASRIAPLQYQAYDAALSLCLLAQSCWRNEVADWTTTFFHDGSWNSRYQGLLSGEPLALALLQMQSLWYGSRHARRLEIVKTVSVKALMTEAKFNAARTGAGARQFAFSLTQRSFDEDYPGHYLRQIVSVAITLPAAIGPLQNVRAIVQQTGSAIVLDMSDPAAALDAVDKKTVAAPSVRFDSNARQSTALSTGLHDGGVLGGDDGRYLPFEATGAVSDWTVTFPYSGSNKTGADRPQADLEQDAVLASLDDIILTLTYTAQDSGKGSDVSAYWNNHDMSVVSQ